jgi:hypothetical protein
MAFCAKCGSEMADGAPFCGACGAPAAQSAAQPAAPMPAPMPPVPGPAYQQPAAGAGGNGAKIALFSLLGLLVAGAVVVLLLGFAVGPKWFVEDKTTTDSGGGGTTTTTTDKDTVAIEKVANTFLEAISKADGTMLASVLSPSEIKNAIGLDPDAKIDDATYKLFSESLTTGLVQAMEADGTKSVKFTNLKYDIKVSGNTATASVIGGEMTTVDLNGNKTTESAKEGQSSEFTLLKEGGKWYVSLESM